MKLTTATFFASIVEPCLDWFSPLSGLYSIVVLTLMCVGLALACKVMVAPTAWLLRFSRAVGPRHDDTPKRHD